MKKRLVVGSTFLMLSTLSVVAIAAPVIMSQKNNFDSGLQKNLKVSSLSNSMFNTESRTQIEKLIDKYGIFENETNRSNNYRLNNFDLELTSAIDASLSNMDSHWRNFIIEKNGWESFQNDIKNSMYKAIDEIKSDLHSNSRHGWKFWESHFWETILINGIVSGAGFLLSIDVIAQLLLIAGNFYIRNIDGVIQGIADFTWGSPKWAEDIVKDAIKYVANWKKATNCTDIFFIGGVII